MILTSAVGLAAAAAGEAWAEEPHPQPTLATLPRLPMIATQGPAVRVEGQIVRSSRGRKGPVRLLVERKGTDPVTVLVAADDYCEQMGLSLRTGESVDVEGTMVKGERPILVASAFTVKGKVVRIRDAQGKLIEAGTATTGGAPSGTPGGTGRPAVMGGGKPPAPAAQE